MSYEKVDWAAHDGDAITSSFAPVGKSDVVTK
jgi:hypothetical protein